jgi:preprotein translocase SecE subunit
LTTAVLTARVLVTQHAARQQQKLHEEDARSMDIKNINYKGIVKGIIDRVVLFFREVKVEIKKISWPQRKETIASTSIVIIIVLIIGIFLGIVDVGLARLVKLILS